MVQDYQVNQKLNEIKEPELSVLSAIADFVFTVDKTNRFSGVYGKWPQQNNLSPEDFLGKGLEDAFGKENFRLFKEAKDKALREGSAIYEQLISLKGEQKYLQISLSPLTNEENTVTEEIVGVGRDITELKRTEEWQQKLLDAIPYPASLINKERRILAQNKATELTSGSKVGDICWFSFHGTDTLSEEQKLEFKESGVLPAGARCIYCKAEEALQKQEAIVEEVELKGKILETGWVPLSKDIYLHYSIDITRYKETERELRKERDLSKMYLDIAEVIFLILNPDGKIELLNRKGAEILGYSQEELVGKNWFEVCIPQTNRDIIKDIFVGLTNGQTKVLKYFENTVLTRNGEERLIAWHNALLKDEKGNIVSVLSAGIDITESRKLEDRITYLTLHDKLTGLYNRNFMEEEIEKLDAEGQYPVSVIMADLNGLKLINDTYGHTYGDKLLQAAAEILKASCRKNDLIARFGGDEFVILLPLTSYENAQKVCRRIRQTAEGRRVEKIPVSFALGIATKEKKEEKLNDILRQAEDEMYQQKLVESRSSRSAIIKTLLKTLEAKSEETWRHIQHMQKLGLALAAKLRLPDSEISRLQLAIMLHDIGKIMLPEEILKKPAPLLQEEWEQMKRHPEFGYRIVRATPEFAYVAEEVWAHHERWDGTGYPRGLKRNEIPLLARIITIADACEVMYYGRTYKKPMSSQEIISELKRKAASQFDPELIEMTIELLSAL